MLILLFTIVMTILHLIVRLLVINDCSFGDNLLSPTWLYSWLSLTTLPD
jgi:hypothetical protein